jgi:hypothetical protein
MVLMGKMGLLLNERLWFEEVLMNNHVPKDSISKISFGHIVNSERRYAFITDACG